MAALAANIRFGKTLKEESISTLDRLTNHVFCLVKDKPIKLCKNLPITFNT